MDCQRMHEHGLAQSTAACILKTESVVECMWAKCCRSGNVRRTETDHAVVDDRTWRRSIIHRTSCTLLAVWKCSIVGTVLTVESMN